MSMNEILDHTTPPPPDRSISATGAPLTPQELNRISQSNINAAKVNRIQQEIIDIETMLRQAAENGCNTIRIPVPRDEEVVDQLIGRGFTVSDKLEQGFILKEITFKTVDQEQRLWLGEQPSGVTPCKTNIVNQ